MQFIDLKAQQARIRGRVDAAIARVLDHGGYIMGPEVKELETRLAAYAGVGHAVSCASGTDALLMALMVKGIGPGDAVLVPTFTFAATAEVVALLGATPVFVDILADTYNMDPGGLAAAVAEARRLGLAPRGVIPVDLFGQPADYAAIHAAAAREGLFVIADAAQSFGATLDGRRVGTLAEITATSFFPAKPLGCYGDGGAVFTDSDEIAETLRSIRVHGKGGHKYDNVRVGLNARLDTLQAAVLLEKLAIFPDEVERRDAVARRYAEGLAGLATPVVMAGATSVWAQYTIRFDDRDAMAAGLKDAGIPTAVYYPLPLHRQTAFASHPTAPGGLPRAEAAAGQVLSLPMHPYLETAEQDTVIAATRRVADRLAKGTPSA